MMIIREYDDNRRLLEMRAYTSTLQWEVQLGRSQPLVVHSHHFNVHLIRLPLLIYTCALILTRRHQG